MTWPLGLLTAVAATASGAVPLAEQNLLASDVVSVSTKVCYRFARHEIVLGETIEADTAVLATGGVNFGIANGAYERVGREGSGLLSQAVLGSRASGSDFVILAVGGRVPGCKTMAVATEAGTLVADIASILTGKGEDWREAPATNTPGAPLQKRMFVKRDASGQVYLMNLFAISLPASELRVLTTVNAVPPGVTLPEGF